MKNIFLLLIALSAVYALIQVFLVKDKFAKIINGVFAVAIGISLIPQKEIAIDGYYLFVIGCLLVILYAYQDSDYSMKKKVVLTLMGFVQLLGMLFFVMRWPNVDIVWWLGLATIAAFGIVIKDIKEYKNEIGFLTVLMISALINIMLLLSVSKA